MTKTLKLAKSFLGKQLEVVIDRPLGSKHPEHGFEYTCNYGFIPKTRVADGEELDAYFLGVNKPIKRGRGICVAVIHRTDNEDDKLVVVPEGVKLSDNDIKMAVNFQEQWFEHKLLRE